MYKRTKITRHFWIQRGFASIWDGIVTLATLGWYDSDAGMKVIEKSIDYGIKHAESQRNRKS